MAVCLIVKLDVSTLACFAILSPGRIWFVALYELVDGVKPLAAIALSEPAWISAENIKEEFPNKCVLALCPSKLLCPVP